MPQPNAPTNEREFDDALADLIVASFANGVRVYGGWDVMIPGPVGPDQIAIEIYPVVRD